MGWLVNTTPRPPCLLTYILTYLFTDLLSPWSKVLEKLTGSQLVKKFPAFCGTRRFITAFKSARHLSLSWARSIRSMPPHPTSWRSILILSSHLNLGFPSGLFPSGFPTKTLNTPLLCPTRATCPAHLIFLDFITRRILEKTRYPLCMRLGGPQARSGRVRTTSPSPGFDLRTVQPVASRYKDFSLPIHTGEGWLTINVSVLSYIYIYVYIYIYRVFQKKLNDLNLVYFTY